MKEASGTKASYNGVGFSSVLTKPVT